MYVSPTRIQRKPSSGGGGGVQVVTTGPPATRTTDWPSSKHQRVSVAGFSLSTVLPAWVTVKQMLGSSQHHHHQGKARWIAGFASLRLIRSVRVLSGAKRSCALRAVGNASPRIR